METNQLFYRTQCMSVLRYILDVSPIREYTEALRALSDSPSAFATAYGALCQTVYASTDRTQSVVRAIQCCNNPLTAHLDQPSDETLAAATFDLETINALLSLSGDDFLQAAAASFGSSPFSFALPPLSAAAPLPFTTGKELCAYYKHAGYGPFSAGTFFTVNQDEELVLVEHPDPIRLSDLKGYQLEKDKLISNTVAFLENRAANNALLYGDKGTGKSSTVKAIANEFAHCGLKIVELSPFLLHRFPMICAEAARSPYHIIVFLDDLSFDHEDNQFATLKAFIEGGLTGKPSNLILYATSNRRHLVRESFSDRTGDEIHARDTMETITSLSDRFGLEITFSVPDKDDYLYIVDELADQYGLDLGVDELHLLAERFALRRNGRSPRTARQFIQFQLSQETEQ